MSLSELKKELIERFTRYVTIATGSDPSTGTHPSTRRQFDLASLLVDELTSLGISDASVDEHCYVTATVEGSVAGETPLTIGLLAHLDTSPDVSGEKVKPVIVERYQGGDVIIDKDKNVILRTDENPHLGEAVNHTIITAGGDTLLGADDKAGIAAIMTLVSHLMKNPQIPHHRIRIAFTPDEEIGEGVALFDSEKFGADFAYTVDGGFTGEINNETFSADSAVVTIKGRDMHPGSAKGRMINSLRIAAAIIEKLPADMAPETTEDRQGYIHPHTLDGCVGISRIRMLLRDFSDGGLVEKRALLETVIEEMRRRYPAAEIALEIKEGYRNMFPALSRHPHVSKRLEDAVKKVGLDPRWQPIRGGTDGSVLTEKGLMTPNIFTAACNAHSLTEWVDMDGLIKTVEVLKEIISL